MSRVFTGCTQVLHQLYIVQPDHLIKEEIILHWLHLLAYGMIAPKPHIDLFCDRCIEVPLAICCQELRVVLSITVYSAVLVRILVLVFKVPGINAHTNSIKPGDRLHLLACQTTTVIHDVFWLPGSRNRHHLLYHYLSAVQRCNQPNYI
jgi:hypothetical protein